MTVRAPAGSIRGMTRDDEAKAGEAPPAAAKGDKLAQRRARQAEALKRNLARRKAQARGRQPPVERDKGS